MKTLYKRTTVGKIQEWRVEVDGNKFRTISGQQNGKQVTSEWTVCAGKNIGKANETSPEDQAAKEALAKWTKKTEKHYSVDIGAIDTDKFRKVMLAKKWDDYPELARDAYSQPKLDGIRCVVNKDGMWTRQGKPILAAPHVFEALKSEFEREPNMEFDGELYTNALKDDFNKIVSLAKKAKPTEENLAESAEHLQYWIYDLPHNNKDFKFRSAYLKEIVGDLNRCGMSCLVYVPTSPVHNKAHLDELYQGYLAAGMEGQMIRKGDSLYEGKRSKNLLKRKEFQDEEFEIVSLNEGIGNYSGMVKSVSFVTDTGIEFDTGIKGNQDYLEELFKDPDSYVGKLATVRYQNLTPDGKPRFGVCYQIWDGDKI